MARAIRWSESDEDAIVPVAIGTVIWAVALIVLLIAKPRLDDSGTSWVIGVAVVGLLSGLIGLVFLRWRKARAQRRRAVSPGTSDPQ